MENKAKTFITLELGIKYYKLIKKLKLPYHLKNQILRAASSISLNLAVQDRHDVLLSSVR